MAPTLLGKKATWEQPASKPPVGKCRKICSGLWSAYYQPHKVILFGSQARGEAGEDSDIDLFIVVDDDTPPERLSWRGKYEARKTYHQAVDIVACRPSVFERKRGVVGSLSHTADQEGVVVYERH